jgi:hypothetical protein
LAAPGDSRTDEERPEEVRDSNRKKKLLLNIKKTQQKTTANIPPVGLVNKKELDRQSLIERDTNSAHFVAAISVRAPLERAHTHKGRALASTFEPILSLSLADSRRKPDSGA